MILDPLAAIVYVAFLIAVALMTMRRPIYAVCTLIIVQPFAFYQGVGATTITLPKVALLGALLGVAAYRYAFVPLRERAARGILVAGVLVLAATLGSLAHAAYHGAVLRETLKMLEYLVLFCVVIAAFRLDRDEAPVRTAIFATAIAVAALALAQEIIGAPSAMLLNGHPIPRIAGPLEGPNQLAGYFDVALPLTFALAVAAPSALANVALFAMLTTEVLTFSRGGAIGAIAAIATVAFIARQNLRPALTAMGAGAATGLGVAVSWGIVANTIGLERFWDFRQSDYAGGVGTRPELWRAAWTLWRAHPVFGVGAGNFEREIPLTGLRGVRTHANSLYLQSLVEGGPPLFAATLWLVYVSIATFVREARQSPFVLAALAAGIALALHQVVDFLTFYPKIGGEWWIALALGAAELGAFVRVHRAACA